MLQILTGLCKKSKGGKRFCLHLSLNQGGCLSRFGVGRADEQGLHLQLRKGRGSGRQRSA